MNMILTNKTEFMTKERLEIIRKYLTIANKKKMLNRFNNVTDLFKPNSKKFNEIIETITLEEIMNVYNKYYIFNDLVSVNDKNY